METAHTLTQSLEDWITRAPGTQDLSKTKYDAATAIVDANMAQYRADGWEFKVHELYPDAPKSQLKLMIREAPGVHTDEETYDRLIRPIIHATNENGLLEQPVTVLGYPNAGTNIASAFVRVAQKELGVEVTQALQEKITHPDSSRELGPITTELDPETYIWGIDDTTTNGETKLEGQEQIENHGHTYNGLLLAVERDPIGSEFVRQKTGKPVMSGLHWLSIVDVAVQTGHLPSSAYTQQTDYMRSQLEWRIQNAPELLPK